MRSVPDEKIGLATPEHVRVSVDFDGDGEHDDEGVFRLGYRVGEIEERPLGDAFPGAFLLTPERPWRRAEDGQLPVVVVLGGGEGGDEIARIVAPMLASRGYAAIGLPYVSDEAQEWSMGEELDPNDLISGLPQNFKEIPIELIERIQEWIGQQPELDPTRIVLHGTSKGAEFALLAACRIDGIAGVVGMVPSSVVWSAFGPEVVDGAQPGSSFSWRGEPLPYMPDPPLMIAKEFWELFAHARFENRDWKQASFIAHPDHYEQARIRVDDIDEPVLLVGGGRDWLWDSAGMAASIKAVRDAAGLETTLVIGRRAGHWLVGSPYEPLEGHSARTTAEGWEALWAFLEKNVSPRGR